MKPSLASRPEELGNSSKAAPCRPRGSVSAQSAALKPDGSHSSCRASSIFWKQRPPKLKVFRLRPRLSKSESRASRLIKAFPWDLMITERQTWRILDWVCCGFRITTTLYELKCTNRLTEAWTH